MEIQKTTAAVAVSGSVGGEAVRESLVVERTSGRVEEDSAGSGGVAIAKPQRGGAETLQELAASASEERPGPSTRQSKPKDALKGKPATRVRLLATLTVLDCHRFTDMISLHRALVRPVER